MNPRQAPRRAIASELTCNILFHLGYNDGMNDYMYSSLNSTAADVAAPSLGSTHNIRLVLAMSPPLILPLERLVLASPTPEHQVEREPLGQRGERRRDPVRRRCFPRAP